MRKTPNRSRGGQTLLTRSNRARLWTRWIQSWRAGDWEVSGNLEDLHFLEYGQPYIPRQPITIQ
ncbi:hypothetical protein Rmet_6764 (plasmid) [Cupriavidus metallidurans CH34]|uniref:Uncharacterized protein n=1 Tax=Cupriavidus metallidurans (strain ATCC 43123 / DSM 2839 / NBRC 102507 / CH34) TaxID=266264 RepID=D3DYH2_CUPMC|nr:hypothetical protein Rmet_6764 [Cupriavidus metallidurans CH34]